MSYGNTPPPGGPADSPQEPQSPGYGTPPPPSYGATPPPPSYGPPSSYGAPPPPANPYGSAPAAPYGSPPQYGATPQYGAGPAYGQPYAQSYAQDGVGSLATWLTRFLGYLIDSAVLIPGYILLAIGIPRTDAATGQLGTIGVTYLIGAIYVLAVVIYNRWYRGGKTGQTIGRGVVGVKLISEKTGQPIGPGMAFVRDIAHVADNVIFYIGWLFPLWDPKRQTLADKIVGTVVVTVAKS